MNRIEDLLDRPKSYDNIDGVGELGLGFMCLSFALLLWLQLHTSADSVWNQMYTLFIFGALLSLALHFGSKAIKKHITYPRTGFVAYRKRDTTWRPLLIALPVSVLGSVALVMAARSHWDTAPVSLSGLLIAASYAHHFARWVRWKWAVAGAIALGALLIAVLPADLVAAPASHFSTSANAKFPPRLLGGFLISMAFYGMLLSLSGAVSFLRYLHRTQPPAQDAQ